MIRLLLFISICQMFPNVAAQDLYVKTFGTKGHPTIVFLHGGPGYNCASFESTTAQKLADKGNFVITYDRRGEGRSVGKAAFTFQEAISDLDSILVQYEIEKPTLIGHSFGGMIGTKFAKKYPDKINALVLVGAPISLQNSFRTVIKSSKELYQSSNDSINLYYIGLLENMDTSNIMYSTYCFAHAMQNGFYSPSEKSEEATIIYNELAKSELAKYASQMTQAPPIGFYKNEAYTTIDLTEDILELVKNKVRIYGIYGKEDGLYSPQQVENLANLIGERHVSYFENCSHSVFIDQQSKFIAILNSITK